MEYSLRRVSGFLLFTRHLKYDKIKEYEVCVVHGGGVKVFLQYLRIMSCNERPGTRYDVNVKYLKGSLKNIISLCGLNSQDTIQAPAVGSTETFAFYLVFVILKYLL